MAAVAGSSAAAALLFRVQGGIARRSIGRPLGDDAPSADRTYQRKLGDPIRLLVVGDSIAAGLGASKPKHTLGARLARGLAAERQRSVQLRTTAVVGSESSMLAAQLDSLPLGYRPDVVVIVVGGNDVMHRVRTAQAAAHLGAAVRRLRALGAEVVVGTCPDLGALPVVPQPLRSLGRRASRRLAAAQVRAVQGAGGHPVSLVRALGPMYLDRPEDMFAEDRFHPSSLGYRRAAKALLPDVLAAAGSPAPGPP
ncbi:MAG: SGNH/GDSL hydrolase family protein [Actinomycetota bacterium]|nr:SGNH/GDSL hydrolase family protein [Actinomycetota bacterium]